MSKLKSCPFCGCRVPPAMQGNGIGDNWLECTECGASTRLREDGAGSEKDWNRRAARCNDTAPVAPIGNRQINVIAMESGLPNLRSDWAYGEHILKFAKALLAAVAAQGAK